MINIPKSLHLFAFPALALLAACTATHTSPAITQDSDPAPPGSPSMLNARDFGATGDARTDDTAALQKALDTAAKSHDTVLLPAGTYLCSTLHIPPQTGLFAHPTFSYRANGGAILKLNDPKAKCLLDLTHANGATLDGLCLDGSNALGENIHGVMVDKPDYGKQEDGWRIQNCRISKFSGCGVFLGRIWCFSIRHSMIAENKSNGIRLRGWDGFILDNWLSGNGDAGFAAYQENASITLTANRIEWNQKAGIEIHAGNAYNITGNYIDRSSGPAIKLAGKIPANSTTETPCSNITITGNLIYRSGAKLAGRQSTPPDPNDNCHLRLESTDGLTCIGNTMMAGRDDGNKGILSPNTAIILRNLKTAIIKDNALNDAALKLLLDDQSHHRGEVILHDNPGTLHPTANP